MATIGATGTRPPAGGRPARALRGLVLASHPLPLLAVVAFATGYAVALGGDRIVLLLLAVTAGQACVGWSNDAIDAVRDAAAGRREKPVAAGTVARRTVAGAAVAAGVAAIALSVPLGGFAAAGHLTAIVAAIAYNAGLKGTVVSPLPYAVAFGLLPVVVTRVAADAWPPAAAVVAAALLGVGAHFGNTVGDAAADAATGVRGLPQRLGPQRSLVVMAAAVGLAAAVLLARVIATGGGDGVPHRAAPVLLAGGVLLAAGGAVRRVGVPGGYGAFRLTLGAVALVVAGFLATL